MMMLLPPNNCTVFPLIVTALNGVPYVGKSKNVFQSATTDASPTNRSAFVILSKVKLRLAILYFI